MPLGLKVITVLVFALVGAGICALTVGTGFSAWQMRHAIQWEPWQYGGFSAAGGLFLGFRFSEEKSWTARALFMLISAIGFGLLGWYLAAIDFRHWMVNMPAWQAALVGGGLMGSIAAVSVWYVDRRIK